MTKLRTLFDAALEAPGIGFLIIHEEHAPGAAVALAAWAAERSLIAGSRQVGSRLNWSVTLPGGDGDITVIGVPHG